ncbi:helix-turn-helix transcriptional regulator [Robertmurraya sp. DFI.2.37]|uniref:helix-turn-helix domain-containing protein n=1 Tax=Robertmurraya sp. DFI.2.37 TaxID=3031819 RepID=UPI0017875487|nr:helix-turn-helix transcriptional regulator [Robertmurraya sp. DFI.2.37]MDF1510533.1 helix-turn-helix transcriptional regulator [Robertmurraya sp. DFI.2.37]
MSLGKRLKSLRTKRKWTLKEVADKLELSSHSTYSNWEYDRTQPDYEMLKKLAELYEVSTDYLINGPGEIEKTIDEDSPEDDAIPQPLKTFFRHGISGISENENELLKEEILDYLEFRKNQLLKKKGKN